MFGFARVRSHELTDNQYFQLRRHYCGLCYALRKDFCQPAGLLTGWDGRFLALLVEAQLEGSGGQSKTRCPATLGIAQKVMVNYGVATRYAAAITVLLLREKLNDNVRDDASKFAGLIKAISGNGFEQASNTLRELGFPLRRALELRERQNLIESASKEWDITEVTAPSAEVVSLIFAHTAVLANCPENSKPLARIGSCVGRLVSLLDACQDYGEDAKQGRFNAIAATLDKTESRLPIPARRFNFLKNYFLVQLREIRLQLNHLKLARYVRTVQNILVMGLYDVTLEACRQFSTYVCQQEHSPNLAPFVCPMCAQIISGYFCTRCGTSRYHNTMIKKEKLNNESLTFLPSVQ